MTLPDALRALAEAVPTRVRQAGGTGGKAAPFQAFLGGAWRDVWWPGPEGVTLIGQIILEHAVREECEARGWPVALQVRPGHHRYRCVGIVHADEEHTVCESTPAEAMARALLSAVRKPLGRHTRSPGR